MSGGLLAFFVVDLLVVRVTWVPAAAFDKDLLDEAHSFALTHPWVVTGATWLSVAGMLVVRWVIIGGLACLLWRKGLPRAAVFVVGVEVLGTALNNLIKIGVDRLRPTFDVPIATASGESFPSGHAMNSMICYALVASALVFSGLVPGKRWARVAAGFVLVLPPPHRHLTGRARRPLPDRCPRGVGSGSRLGRRRDCSSAPGVGIPKASERSLLPSVRREMWGVRSIILR